MVSIVFYILILLLINFSLWVTPFGSVVLLGVGLDNQGYEPLCKVFLLFADVILRIRSFFTIYTL